MTWSRAKTLLVLHVLLLFYSLADVASKFAAGYELLSLGFIVCYGLVLVVLAGYALGWQQIIKRMPLTTAYANRGITVVWGIFWGAVLFGEAITPFKVVGAAMIIAGIVLFSHADGQEPTAPVSAQEAASPDAPAQETTFPGAPTQKVVPPDAPTQGQPSSSAPMQGESVTPLAPAQGQSAAPPAALQGTALAEATLKGGAA